MLTASTSEAYSFLFKLLCDPGDDVLVPQPSYPLFDLLTALDGVRPSPYRLDCHGGWCLDRDEPRARALTATTRAVLVVSPNNPTGSMLRRDDREWLVALARAHGLALISDEVFADYPLAPRRGRDVAARRRPGADVHARRAVEVGGAAADEARVDRRQRSRRPRAPRRSNGSRSSPTATCRCRRRCRWRRRALLEAGRRRPRRRFTRRIARRTSTTSASRPAGARPSRCSNPTAAGRWCCVSRLSCRRSSWCSSSGRGHGVLVHPGYFFDLDAGVLPRDQSVAAA